MQKEAAGLVISNFNNSIWWFINMDTYYDHKKQLANPIQFNVIYVSTIHIKMLTFNI